MTGDAGWEAREPDGSEVCEWAAQAPFTALDRIPIDVVADTAEKIVGALSESAIDEAVNEFARLNGRRDRAHFLAGFRDALFERPCETDSSAVDAVRVRWYWAGALARRGSRCILPGWR